MVKPHHILELDHPPPVGALAQDGLLSPRELEILDYVARGQGNKHIARAMCVSEQTIKNHITCILRKLDANNRTHAVVLSLRNGWISI